MWDGVSDNYSNIFLMTTVNNHYLFSRKIPSDKNAYHCMTLECYSESKTINLTKITDAFHVQSMYHIQDINHYKSSCIISNSGAYISLSPNKDNFVCPIETVSCIL